MSNHIIMDAEQFKKTAKKLQVYTSPNSSNNSINSIESNTEKTNNISHSHYANLSEAQETLSQILGFRNYSAIQQFFNKNKSYVESSRTHYFLEGKNETDIRMLFDLLINDFQGNKEQSLSLVFAVFSILKIKYDESKQLSNFDVLSLQEYLIFESCLKLFNEKHNSDHPNIFLSLELHQLPQFQPKALRQSDITREAFLKISSPLAKPFFLLKKLEHCDPLIFCPSWFNAVFTNEWEHYPDTFLSPPEQPYEDSQRKNYTFISTNSRLDNLDMNKFYSKFSQQEWSYYCNKIASKFNSTVKLKVGKDGSSYTSIFHWQSIEPISPILHSSVYENSWLADSSFQEILFSFFKNKEFKPFYLSDLIFYSFKIINQTKREQFLLCVKNLLNNYSTVVDYSSQFNQLSTDYKS